MASEITDVLGRTTYADTVSCKATKFTTVTQQGNRHVYTIEHVPKLKGQRTITITPHILRPATYQCIVNQYHIAQCVTN